MITHIWFPAEGRAGRDGVCARCNEHQEDHPLSRQLVTNIVAEFPERFGLRGFPGDVFRASKIHSYVNDAGTVTVYLERLSPQRESYWLAHSKGSVAEIQREMVVL